MDETVYAVTTGSYSDYRVHAVCRTKAGAERLAGRMRADVDGWHTDADTIPLPVVDPEIEQVVTLSLSENLWDDGTTSDVRDGQRTEWPFIPMQFPKQGWRWVRAPVHQGKGGRLEVWGTDHEAVRRVFSDKRAEIRATPALSGSRERKSAF